MRKLRIAAVVATLAAGMAGNALAAERGAFVGLEVGTSDLDVDIDEVGSGSDSDQAFAIRGGYYFTPNLAVEAFHADLYGDSQDGASLDLNGYGVGLVARRNFGADGNGFYLQARGGAFRGKGSVSLEDFGSGSDTSTVPYFGVGAGYDFSRNIGVGLNYIHYRGDFDGVDIDSNTLTGAVEYRF